MVSFLRAHRRPSAGGNRASGGSWRTEIQRARHSSIEAIVNELEQLTPLAPLHQPNNLRPIRVVLERQPHLLQVACFDTAFHRGHPEVADRYALPEPYYAAGSPPLRLPRPVVRVHRQASCGNRHPNLAKGRVVVAHLGSGASMCAISERPAASRAPWASRPSTDLPMGTRPGQLDAGVVLYLVSEKGMSAEG